MNEIKAKDDWLDAPQLVCTKTDGKTKYDFNKFVFPSKFTSKMYHRDLTLQEAENDQQQLKILINKLNNDCNRKNQIKIGAKNDTLKSAKKSFNIRNKIISAFKKGVFPYIDGFQAQKNQMKNLCLNVKK